MVGEISPREYAERSAAGADMLLLDVREARELEIASLPGVTWIPMAEVPARLDELPRDRTIVVLCRSGGRSRNVANYLYDHGFPDVLNLEGGILRWAQELDPSLTPY